jgi:hypothetical protein
MIVFGSFFLMRLVVAVVIQHYSDVTTEVLSDSPTLPIHAPHQFTRPRPLITQDENARGSGKDGLVTAATEEELKWIHMQEMLLNYATIAEVRLKPPHWICLVNRFCFELAYGVGATLTANIIYFCIIANTVLMAARHFGQNEDFSQVCVGAQDLFAIIFMAEVVIKLLAIGGQYFKENWNNFDFIVGVGGFISVIAKYVNGANGGTFVSLLRVLRLGRIIRLLKHSKQLRELLGTILLALPPLFSLSCVLILFYFMYAAMGVQLFAKVRLINSMSRPLNEGFNFQNFFSAIISLLPPKKNGVMHELGNWEGTECTDDPPWDPNVCGFFVGNETTPLMADHDGCVPLDGCGSWLAYPYMMSFYWFMSFIILNLFTAVIIKEYANASDNQASLAASRQDLTYDPRGNDEEDGSKDKVKR